MQTTIIKTFKNDGSLNGKSLCKMLDAIELLFDNCKIKVVAEGIDINSKYFNCGIVNAKLTLEHGDAKTELVLLSGDNIIPGGTHFTLTFIITHS